MIDINDALNEAHEDYERRKNEILTKLKTISQYTLEPTFVKWLDQAIDFIKEKEI